MVYSRPYKPFPQRLEMFKPRGILLTRNEARTICNQAQGLSEMECI
ncbi:hypothetical protein CLV83_2322 [Marinobacterium mangrovicola]|uniref:Uncharacterized protein n=1 Tax=Marinobacterium mangrovicola TaxID=1476959 RepID=A0A4R1GJU8_9GAMM|nr:hypothetical protein CLV83_2322 [Marinobacterium mangrovicola]